MSFALITACAFLALGAQLLSIEQPTGNHLALSWAFGAGAYFITICYLLVHVFQQAVITQDKLYGAAADYLMLGVLWSYFHALVQYLAPGVCDLRAGAVGERGVYLLQLYRADERGFSTVTPVLPIARSVTILEQITGVLFVAILIARLASSYSPGGTAGNQ